jgi:4-amino-4-deoxy-L-arabinose transferase-like glycosyltransferase
MLAALWFLYLAARHSAPAGSEVSVRRGAGAAATLLLVGSIGLIVHAHEAVPDLASLAAMCAALAFLSFSSRKPLRNGLAFGASLGIAFLSTGPLVPAVIGTTALLAHLACDEWRSARALRFLVPAAVAFAVIAASWPLVLYLRAPEIAQSWWFEATHARGEFWPNLRYYLSVASWFAWPAWPLALWSAWNLRREIRSHRIFVPLAAAVLALPAIAWLGPQQDINAIALLAPLALLGAHGVARLRRGATNALDWFGVMTFGFFTALVWVAYIAMYSGVPPKIANNFFRTAPGFTAHFELLPFVVALALTLAWLYLAFFTAPSPTRGVTRWATGVALLWGTFAMLLMPWADHIRSYRGVALQLKASIPAGAACIAQSELATPQRAALSYHAGIRTEPLRARRVSELPKCRYLIVQGSPKEERSPGPGWRKIAEASRPADRGERYRLYRYGPG